MAIREFASRCAAVAAVLFGAASASAMPEPPSSRERNVLELEGLAHQYAEQAAEFRKDVLSVFQREIDRRKANVQSVYKRESKRINDVLQVQRRESIQAFEAFLGRHPDHPRYSPEVMFRLAKLYYDQSQDDYLNALPEYDAQLRLYRRGKVADEPVEPAKSFEDSIRMYQTLVDRFPAFEHADAALYALGFTLRQADDPDRAALVFQRLIDGYPDSEWLPEAWLMVGEHSFDMGKYAEAVESYKRALGKPDGRYYAITLYKLAWSYFQMYEYPTAIRTFKQLIEYIDSSKERTGRAVQVRSEAIEYLGLSLADEDWNGDGLPDPDANVARALSYLSENKPYEREILERYADALYNEFEMRKFPMAIEAYRAVIAREPLNPLNAAVKEKVIAVYDTMRDSEGSVRERLDLVKQFGPGSPWYDANKDHPEVLARVDRRLELALNQAAQFHHRRAQEMKAQASRTGDETFRAAALQEYKSAADAYAEYLRRFPDSRYAYENAYYYADCLYFSFDFQRASEIYRKVRDWPLKTQYLESAAFNTIDSTEKEAAKRVRDGQMPAVDAPGDLGAVADEKPPAGASGKVEVVPQEVPVLVQQWIADVDVYLAQKLSRASDAELPSRLAYRVASEYYKRRNLAEARKRFEEILTNWPESVVASYAAASIINSFRLENDWASIQIWAKKVDEMKVGKAEDRAALATEVRLFQLGAQFKEAEGLFDAKQFTPAAEAFLKVVDGDPKHKLADKALQNAALAYQQDHKHESAAAIYERIVRDYPTSQYVEGALVQLAENARKVFDFDRAINTWGAVVSRFPKSEQVPYALFTQAQLLEAQGKLKDSARTLERYADRATDPTDAGQVLFRAGTLNEKSGNAAEAVRLYKRLLKEHGGDAKLSGLVVESLARMAQMAKADGNRKEYERLSLQVIAEFDGRGLAADTPVAAFPARARFELIEPRFEQYAAIQFRGALKVQGKLLQEKARLLEQLEGDYRKVLPYKALEWTTAGYYRLAQIHELFARALFEAEIPEMSEEEMDIYQTAIEDKARSYQEMAQQRYETLVAEARRLKFASEWTRKAIESLNKYRPAEFPLQKQERRAMDLMSNQAPTFEEGL
jgi:TolA-binding protein